MAETAFIDEIAQIIKDRNIHVRTIFDLGACELEESLYLADKFPESRIVSCEANPFQRATCNRKAAGTRIEFHSCAIGDRNGWAPFHVGDDPKQSSSFPINEGRFRDLLHMEVRTQQTVQVEVRRLDSFPHTPDLLFMDIQCSELRALHSLGERLKDVAIIATELMLKSTYDCAPPFDDVDALLKDHFDLVRGNPFEGVFDNFVYVNRRPT